MSIEQNELKLYGSAVMPDDSVPTEIGGAIDKTRKMEFFDGNGSFQIVSSDGGDTTQSITVTYRDSTGAIMSEAKTLSGLSPVAFVASFERLLKAIKGATTVGDVGVELSVAERTGTAQGGAVDSITLDAGASGTDDFFNGMVLRITSGTGSNQIRQVIDYDGTTKIAKVNANFTVTPDATSVFRLSKGMFFDKTPVEIFEVRRIFFDASANPPGGLEKRFYEKGFYENTDGALSLTSAQVIEFADASGLVNFGLTVALNDSTTNGVGNNREVAPAGITFDSADKAVVGNTLGPGDDQGIWFELVLAGGAASLNTTYVPELQGNTT